MDDFLITSHDEDRANEALEYLIAYLDKAGFLVNRKKSNLVAA